MNHIKHWREARGLTLQQLGDAIDPPASPGTISSYESGARDVSMKRLSELAKALKVTPGKLLDGPMRMPTEGELASMIELAQREIKFGATIADYPSAVASSLRGQLLRFAGEPANADAEIEVPLKSPAAASRSRPATKKVARG